MYPEGGPVDLVITNLKDPNPLLENLTLPNGRIRGRGAPNADCLTALLRDRKPHQVHAAEFIPG
jgi:hypothetical protein